MVRSLLGKWRQTIYDEFDKPMSENIITEEQGSGFPLIDVVSDMDRGNRAVWKQLGINTEKTHFPNSNDHTKNIFVFADGFVTEVGETIDNMYVQHLVEKSAHDLRLLPNLTQLHLDVKGSAGQTLLSSFRTYLTRHLFIWIKIMQAYKIAQRRQSSLGMQRLVRCCEFFATCRREWLKKRATRRSYK
ncbi:hypothetical protein PR048_028335 [Dryococelus australis]|uniref:Uncharacterized protein n=1 Tax=Dryococelus australis TaxID=614101 RepID=A0ABQ9GIX6_9NEOP|nr:hypothetical protein PR048_028335 [Dryococelus australis]